jgi:hypothetical protein
MMVELFTFYANVSINSVMLFVGALSMKEPPEEADNEGLDFLKCI